MQIEWMNKMMKINNLQNKKKIYNRLDNIGKLLNQRRNKEINQIKINLTRDLRKLNLKYHNNKIANMTIDVNKEKKQLIKNSDTFKITDNLYQGLIKEKLSHGRYK